MIGKIRTSCTVLVSLIMTGPTLAQPVGAATPGPTGEWLVAQQVARIKIADCDGRLWGVVAWETQPGIDSKNQDPNLRSRPTLGMPILLGMTPDRSNKWDGQIYNAQDGRTYSASITLVDPNTLRVQGCFLGLLCGGENWTRFETQGTQSTVSTQSAKPPNGRKTTGNRPDSTDRTAAKLPEPTDDVCSRILGSSGLPHERGLK